MLTYMVRFFWVKMAGSSWPPGMSARQSAIVAISKCSGSVGSSRSAQSQKSNLLLFHWWQFATQGLLENMIFFLYISRKTLSPASDFKSKS